MRAGAGLAGGKLEYEGQAQSGAAVATEAIVGGRIGSGAFNATVDTVFTNFSGVAGGITAVADGDMHMAWNSTRRATAPTSRPSWCRAWSSKR